MMFNLCTPHAVVVVFLVSSLVRLVRPDFCAGSSLCPDHVATETLQPVQAQCFSGCTGYTMASSSTRIIVISPQAVFQTSQAHVCTAVIFTNNCVRNFTSISDQRNGNTSDGWRLELRLHGPVQVSTQQKRVLQHTKTHERCHPAATKCVFLRKLSQSCHHYQCLPFLVMHVTYKEYPRSCLRVRGCALRPSPTLSAQLSFKLL